jgi:HPt (histidine-containing phosphotransfer) domain-containing protein
MNDLTGGDPTMLRELVEMFYKQTSQAVEADRGRRPRRNATQVRRVAHSCKGASATLGMTQLSKPMLRAGKNGASKAS